MLFLNWPLLIFWKIFNEILAALFVSFDMYGVS